MPPKTRSQPDAPGMITTKQMRELHVRLSEYGIHGDVSVHDYIDRALAEIGADADAIASASESRSNLSAVHAAHLIADLEQAEPAPAPGPKPSQLTALRKPFESEAIGKLPRSTCKACSDSPRKRCDQHTWINRCSECNNNHSSATMHIDYVGHADVTARLLEVDPHWSWRPWSGEELMALNPQMRDAGLWIWLNVLGIERAGFGDADGKRGGNAVKEMIGDALRNAAMRFGVALDLWAKGDRDWAHAEKDGAEDMPPDAAPPRQDQPAADVIYVTADEVLGQLESYRMQIVDDPPDNPRPTWEQFSEKFRAAHGGITVEQLGEAPVERLMQWEQSVRTYLNSQQ